MMNRGDSIQMEMRIEDTSGSLSKRKPEISIHKSKEEAAELFNLKEQVFNLNLFLLFLERNDGVREDVFQFAQQLGTFCERKGVSENPSPRGKSSS